MRYRVYDVQQLRELIGLHVYIVVTSREGAIGGAGLMIGVTQTSAAVYADLVDGVAVPIPPDFDRLTVHAIEPCDVDMALFREHHGAGYYPNLPLNDRLRSILA